MLLDCTNVMPSTNTPEPDVRDRHAERRLADRLRRRRSRSSGSISEERMIQQPQRGADRRERQRMRRRRANTSARRRARSATTERQSAAAARLASPPRFQRAWMPSASSASSGSIGTRKLGLKYGGPTESVPR